jgi:hypothetical protein
VNSTQEEPTIVVIKNSGKYEWCLAVGKKIILTYDDEEIESFLNKWPTRTVIVDRDNLPEGWTWLDDVLPLVQEHKQRMEELDTEVTKT